jgi:hypothetical protein
LNVDACDGVAWRTVQVAFYASARGGH